MKKVFLYCLTTIFATGTYAQTYNWVSSTEANIWQQSKVNAARKSKVDDNTARMQSIKQLGV